MKTEDMSNSANDNPGVLAPPPLIFLGGILAGILADWLYPSPVAASIYLTISQVAGIILAASGLGVIVVVRARMKRAETNIEPWKPTNAILTDGIYSVSRNPIYAAMVIAYLGIALLLNSFWFLPFLIVIMAVMHFGVILREESYLERKFGEEYVQYKANVRRWI